jgi:hypothetical protein
LVAVACFFPGRAKDLSALPLILLSTNRTSKWSLSVRYPIQLPIGTCLSFRTCHLPYRLTLTNYMKLNIINFLYSPATFSVLILNIFLNNVFPKILRHQIHIHMKQRSNLCFYIYILVRIFLDSKREDEILLAGSPQFNLLLISSHWQFRLIVIFPN